MTRTSEEQLEIFLIMDAFILLQLQNIQGWSISPQVFFATKHVVPVLRSCAGRPWRFAAFAIPCRTPVVLTQWRSTDLPVLWPMSLLTIKSTILIAIVSACLPITRQVKER